MQIIARSDTVEAVTTPEGATRRLLSHGGGLMVVEFTFTAGTIAPVHHHPHEQVGYVVSGDLTLHMEGRPDERLTAGASYYVPPNVPHGVDIHADTVLVDVFTPQREDFLPGPAAGQAR